MSGFGGALARGLAGYAQNRMIVDERDYRRKQDEAAALRQAEKDKEDAEFRRLQMAQVTEQMQRNRAQDATAAEGRMNAARADGLRSTDEARSMGGALGAGRGFASAGGAFGAVGGSLGALGEAMQQRAQRPDATINGQSMVRMAESDQDRRDRIANQTKQGELMQAADAQRAQFEGLVAQLPAAIRPLATDLASAKALAAKVAEQRMAPAPREAPVNMQVIQTADGPMAFNPRTGRAEPITAGGQPVRGAASSDDKPTAVQLQAQGFYDRMQQSSKIMDAFEQGGTLPSANGTPRQVTKMDPVRSPLARGLSVLPLVGRTMENNATDTNRQQYWNAASNWVRANLRKESGAAIGAEEMDQEIATYFPMAGDSREVREQKRQLRATTEAAMARMANTPQRADVPPDAAQPQSIDGLANIFTRGGRK